MAPAKKTTTTARKPAASKPAVLKTAASGLSVGVFDIAGKEVKRLDLPKEIFAVDANPQLIAHYIRVYTTNQRQGTVATKTRAEVNYTTKKMYRQKGTGRARHGAKSAPIFVGGGVTFGPQPREYRSSINKKQRRKALFAALTLAYKNNAVSGLSDAVLSIEPKTSQVAGMLKNRELAGKKTLIVLPKMEKKAIVLASRNIPTVELIDAASLNAFAVLSAKAILFAESAVPALKDHFFKKNEN